MNSYSLTIPSQWIGPGYPDGMPLPGGGHLGTPEKTFAIVLVHHLVGLHSEAAHSLRQFGQGGSPLFYAKSFVSTADQIHNALEALSELVEGHIPDGGDFAAISQAAATVKDQLPMATALRDSIQHADERIRMLARNKPIKNPPSTVYLGCLERNEFVSMIADGSTGRMAISHDAMMSINSAIGAALEALVWDPNGQSMTVVH
jgi:hypothetical protein